MKKAVLFALFVMSIQAIGQNRLAILSSSTGMEYGKASAVDRDGHYINGSLFQNTINVNPNGTTNLTAPGLTTQIALTKYNPQGQLLWGKHFGGTTTSEAPHGIATDQSRNIYVTGYFGSTTLTGPQSADFNPAGGGTIATQGNEDIFVAKYDSSGNYQWAFGLGNVGQETQERAWDITADPQGNTYVTGGFHGTMNFNPLGTPMNLSLPDATAGLFLVKYNTNGIAQWAVILDVKGNDVFAETYATCDLDANGNIFIAGNFRGTNVNFNPLGTSVSLSSAGQNDIFLAKYSTANGSLAWAKRIGGPAQDLVSPGALRCDNNGNPYFTGRLSGTGTVNFDPNGGTANVVNSALYLVSYDANGNIRHYTGMSSGAGDGGHRVAFDQANNVYISGWMNGTVTFGAIARTANSTTADVFLAKYSNDLATCLWALNFGGSGSSANSIAAGLSVDNGGNPIVTGQLYGTNANVDPNAVTPINLSSVGNNDCFVIKYGPDGRVAALSKAPFDFDGDRKTDLSIFRPAVGEWWISKSGGSGVFAAQFGSTDDRIAPADFTGDGKADIALWRPSNGTWYVLRSEDLTFYAFPFGSNGDVPMPADFDADGKSDAAIFRPAGSTWYVLRSSDAQISITQFGTTGDRPVAADYDGDGRADIAIFRPVGASGAEWWIARSTGGTYAATFGTSTDLTVPGDWTGDGTADIAFWRPNGFWYVLKSEDSSYDACPFGTHGDVPSPGDFDGDGKFDAAVFRQPGSQWYVVNSGGGTTITQFGTAGDRPIPSAYVR